MTNFEKYVENMENSRRERKRAEINEFLQRNLKESSLEQTKRGLYAALGLLAQENVI